MRRIGFVLLAVAALLACAAFAFGLLAIWTGDDRWGASGILTLFAAIPIGGAGAAAMVP